jgi:hypothetical protein
LLFGKTTEQPAPGDVSGKASFSVLKDAWAGLSSGDRAKDLPNHASLQRDLSTGSCPAELHGTLDVLKGIRQRILTNTVLEGWTEWSICILIGLLVAGAVIAKLAGVLILSIILLVIGMAVIFTWIWRTRPSTYETACRLDAAAGLQDRVSTAIYLSDVQDSEGMIHYQRRDAISRLAKVDPRGLFSVRTPATAIHALVLVLVFGGLFVYRINHRAPLIALLQSTARSSLVQSIFSPIVHAMEKDLERTIALVTMKPDPVADEVRPGEALPTADNLWQPLDDKNPDAKDTKPQDVMNAQDEDQEGQPQGQGNPNAMPPADAQQQQGNNGQPQQGDQKQSDSQGSQQSLSQKMMDALKNMMSDPKNQQNSKNGQQQNPQSSPQQGGNPPPGSQESDKKGDSKGISDQKQNASKSAGSGAGSQKGTNEMRKDQAARPVNATPDRVALEATGFKEQTRMRVDTETGEAHMAVKDGSPQADSVINGAEQENIPARYRLYVQRYFEHTDNGSKSSSEPH